jgi:M6 family metalloprotease-like protein
VGLWVALALTAAPSPARAWEKIWGPTDFLVVDGETKTVYARPTPPTAQDIYRWEPIPNAWGGMTWTALGMPAKAYVTAGHKPNSALFALSSAGKVYRFKGTPGSWEDIGAPAGGQAGALYGGPDGFFVTDTKTGELFRWGGKPGVWSTISTPSMSGFTAVAVGESPEFSTQVYGLLGSNAPANVQGVYQYTGSWFRRGNLAGGIYASGTRLFATNPTSGDLMSLYPTGWKHVGWPGKMFAPDGRAGMYGLSDTGVYRWTGTPNQWDKIGDPAGKIFAGGGRVFATDIKTGDLFRYIPPHSVPDLAATQFTQKMKPVSGKQRVLVILWDPHRPDNPAPPKQDIDHLIFGPGPCAKDWFQENSGGKLILDRTGVLGWYNADKPASHYWSQNTNKNPNDPEWDGWSSGHVEKWTEAILKASKDINFAAFDTNGDKVLSREELTIVIGIPQNKPFGTARQGVVSRQLPTAEPLIVQGVQMTEILEWYIGKPPNLGTACHEMCHQILDAPDMYFAGPWPYAAAAYSIMDSCAVVHLDPFEKLKLGWLKWKAPDRDGVYELRDVEMNREALILYSTERGPAEYFIVENRWRDHSYEAQLPADGVAVWHIVENPAVFNKVSPFPPTGVKDEWGRLGIRMIRANGGTPVDDTKALFKKGDVVSDNLLRWMDGTPSGFELKVLTDPGSKVQLQVTLP